MKTTQMVFRKLEIGEKITKDTYYYTKSDNGLFMSQILDYPSLFISEVETAPCPNAYYPSIVEENDGNFYYRRV